MAYLVRQGRIWEHLEREFPAGLGEVREFLHLLSEFDGPLVQALEKSRGQGRDDYPVRAMWHAIAVALLLRHSLFASLIAELQRNSDLAQLLGFEPIGPNLFRTPSPSAVSRFHSKLKADPFVALVEDIFTQVTLALCKLDPQIGKNIAVDASDVRSHAKPPRKNREGGEDRPSSDPEAGWSIKTKTSETPEGQREIKIKSSTYGYKLYAAIDARLPVVLHVSIEPGNTSDFDMAPHILQETSSLLGDRIETAAMDKGFDSEGIVASAWELGIAAVVPVRGVPKELDQQLPEDREVALEGMSNIVRDRYTGEVACYDTTSQEPVRRTMTYAGFDPERECHKFRCPMAAAGQVCPAAEICSAGSAGKHGRQVRVSMEVDQRRFGPIYPRSKRWKRLYNGRSSVERLYGYLKGRLELEDHALRGRKAITLRCLLAALTLNVQTLLALRAEISASLSELVAA